MIHALLLDFSKVLIFAKDPNYTGSLNSLYKKVCLEEGNNFSSYFEINIELLDYLRKIKPKCTLFIFTSGKLHALPQVKEKLGTLFRAILETDVQHLDKQDSYSYSAIAEKMQFPISDILFIDDQLLHIKAAEFSGMQAIQFENNKQIIECLQKLIV